MSRDIANECDQLLAAKDATITQLRASLARVTAERDANHKVIARLQEIAMSITTDDDQPCVICGDTYDVDHGKDDTGFCHQCATETLAELLAAVVFPEAPQ